MSTKYIAPIALAIALAGCTSTPAPITPEDASTYTDAWVRDASMHDAGIDALGCALGETRCGGGCARTATDPAHCGGCDMACPTVTSATVTCEESHCAFVCMAGYVASAGACLPAPRPIAPISTGTVTSRRPTFRWIAAPGTADTTIDLCADRACTTLLDSQHVATETTFVPATDLPSGVVYWRLRPGTSTTLSSAVWQLVVGARTAPVDTSWGTTLDVNGDGYADLAVGAGGVSMNTGRAHLYLGSADGPLATPATSLTGPDGPGGGFGHALTSAGDVNGDGFADLAIAAWGASSNTGRVYVHLGSEAGLGVTAARTLTGPDGPGGQFGITIASAGDLNGDGFADLAVGARGAGRIYVYSGSAAGLRTTATVTLSSPDGVGDSFGSVTSAGDVNGDGFADLVVGAPTAASSTGRAHVYLGSTSGLGTTPATSLTGPDGVDGWFGNRGAIAADVNGDGFADLIVCAPLVSSYSGRAHVYLGSASGLGAIPVASLNGPDGAEGWFGNGGASTGDVNGDGFADIALGAYAANTAHVYLGSATGLGATPATSLSNPDSTAGHFGWSLGRMGDTNGDGYGDLSVSAIVGIGHVYFHPGGAAGIGTVPTTTFTGPDGRLGQFGSSIY